MRKRTALFLTASALAAPALMTPAYANTLTRLIPELYAGLDVVSRELVGFIPSVNRNTSAERAAVGQAVVWPVSPQLGTFDVAPAMQVPEPADITMGNGDITITKSKGATFGMTGEEQLGLNTGAGALTVQADLFAQAVRALVNEIETDIGIEAARNGSRAYGTAGTTPFATNLADAARIRQILDDNGAPASERSLVVNTDAGVNLRTLAQLTKVNEAGTSMTLRDGQLLDLFGLSTKESAGVQRIAAGTGAAATTNSAGYAIGATVITLAAAGTGTILVGDVVSFAGDTNKYLVVSGDADVTGGGAITLALPGLRVAIPAAPTAITLSAISVRNVGFTRTALALASRAPALPNGKDSAVERFSMTDPRSGLVFEISIYEGYRKMRAEVTMAWGVKAVKKEHIAILLG